MRLNLDIISSLVHAIAKRDPALLAHHDEAALNRHRELLLTNEFAGGNSSAPTPADHQPFSWTYSQLELTGYGERLHEFTNRADLWQRAKDAYELDGCSWSLTELYEYLESQAK